MLTTRARTHPTPAPRGATLLRITEGRLAESAQKHLGHGLHTVRHGASARAILLFSDDCHEGKERAAALDCTSSLSSSPPLLLPPPPHRVKRPAMGEKSQECSMDLDLAQCGASTCAHVLSAPVCDDLAMLLSDQAAVMFCTSSLSSSLQLLPPQIFAGPAAGAWHPESSLNAVHQMPPMPPSLSLLPPPPLSLAYTAPITSSLPLPSLPHAESTSRFPGSSLMQTRSRVVRSSENVYPLPTSFYLKA